ncbi:DUF2156 domain-containing protein [Pseudomonas batumici]|uniref:BatQ n=2 Tax=Pseudomonas TaxID=286 RepID=D4NZF2_PSEFL|nr:DUF2156 domain-containing protein [Pseudomonas batumici]ADD82958.1 BatQ [Pseudomonas fluorescens]KIH86022.1 BatQ, batumin synthesis operon, putative integral membrane protein [Pseudomonas batumici]
MDTVNSFESPNTRAMARLEYGFLLVASVAITLYHWGDVRIIPLIILFSYIDIIGYFPGAIAYRRCKGKVADFYYVLYNGAHNFLTAALVAALWCYFVEVEWALMGILIHLFGDRSLFGNGFKSRAMSFEPRIHPLYEKFEALMARERKLNGTVVDIGRKFLWAERFGNHPSLFLTLSSDISTFTVEGLAGYLPFQDDGKCLFILTGVISAADNRESLLKAFISHAVEHGRELCCVQLRQDQAPLFERLGFQVNQMGCSYTLDLERFSMAGSPFMSLRNKIKRAEKAGVIVKELGVDLPNGPDQQRMLSSITEEWLKAKGSKKLLSFMVGDLAANGLNKERIFVAVLNDKIVGFISYVPAFGEYNGWMHDLTRRLAEVPPGTMELVNVEAIKRFKQEGEKYLNFGLTPFYGVDDEFDTYTSRSHLLKWILSALEKYGQRIYPAASQVAYKLKWQPMVVTPEYFATYGKFRVGILLRLMKLTNAL